MQLQELADLAAQEVQNLISVLPEDVQAALKNVTFLYEAKPGNHEADVELDGDEFSCFIGTTHDEDPDPEYPSTIRLFVQNIWEFVEHDEQDFLDEVGASTLDEIGAYLNWAEDDEDQDSQED